MAKCFSLVLLLVAVWTMRLLVQASLQVQELSIETPCRLRGITVVRKKTEEQLNFHDAKEACRLLGLTLASRAQVETAWKYGFETCSYGWVKDGSFVVISRLIPKPTCGKNGVGVLTWKVSAGQKFRAYCYNSSDTWLNSCLPEISTTEDPTLSTPTSTDMTEIDVSNTAYATSSPSSAPALTSTTAPAPTTSASTPAPPSTSPPARPSTSTPRKTKLICVTEIFMKTSTLAADSDSYIGSQGAFKNEVAEFGGVPTALLVLALLFFAAAAGLAYCYVKRYMKAFPFTNKSQQKETVETKTVKGEKADDSNPTEELKKLDNKTEESKSPPKTTVRCMEAEV